MGFPDIKGFPESYPGAYERQMGEQIAELLRLFEASAPDRESNVQVADLASNPARWLAGHALFDEVRKRLLIAMQRKCDLKCAQYCFEESCLQALYNAANPLDPFDPCSPFWVAGTAIALARAIGVSEQSVLSVLAPD